MKKLQQGMCREVRLTFAAENFMFCRKTVFFAFWTDMNVPMNVTATQ